MPITVLDPARLLTLMPDRAPTNLEAGMLATRTVRMLPVALVLLILVAPGCRSASRTGPTTPTSVGIPPSELVDPHGYGDSPELPIARDFFRVAERIRLAQKPAQVPPRKTCLALSGGGSFGAYQ